MAVDHIAEFGREVEERVESAGAVCGLEESDYVGGGLGLGAVRPSLLTLDIL